MNLPFFAEEAPASPTRKPAPKHYPDKPGWKAEGTSRDAAEGIAPKAGTLCDETLACLKERPGTPEEVAKRLKQPVHSIRPRFSQLAAKNLIVKTDERRRAMGGRMASVWRAAS